MFDKHYNNLNDEKLNTIISILAELQEQIHYICERVSKLSVDVSRVEDKIADIPVADISKNDIEAVKNMIRETNKEVREIKKGVVRIGQAGIEKSQIKIMETGLDTRTKNVLMRAGYVYLQDLEGKKRSELLSIKNLGKSCLHEIIEECEAHQIII